ncbi:MAG TPA: hypothetical protein VM940_16365 [Chthoniobacterales bacterium]|jgi:hypothetical protein|nr:hypothetical protein [Chthoniobacterales bacterium]
MLKRALMRTPARASLQIGLFALLAFAFTGCGTMHQFAGPARDWQARNGQLHYKGKRTSLIGEVLVRFSKAGDFELTFSKGPGVTLLEIRQNANFFRVKGPLAGVPWSGTTANAPGRLRGWLELRDKLIALGDKTSLTHSYGGETFTFRF